MPRTPSVDQEKALQLLKAALGEFDEKRSLKRIISNTKDFGTFEWMLTIIGLEIDLRVDIPESLSDDHDLSASEFCKLVAKLPKVDSPGYTLECLGLVAQALLSLDLPVEAEKHPSKDRPAPSTRNSDRKRPDTQRRSTRTAKTDSPKPGRGKKTIAAARPRRSA